MIDLEFTFSGEVWIYSGKAAWHFVTLPTKISQDIKTFTRHNKTGWGAVRVCAKIGDTEWSTALFPDKTSGAYFLPLKAEIRKKEAITAGDEPAIKLRVIV